MSEDKYRYVGQSVAREDGPEKATGAARYTHDLSFAGMLHAAILKSPHASAKIVRIDTTKAQAVPGVRAVLTGGALTYRLGIYLRDKQILANGIVRYQGEAVAAVAAETLDAARKAVSLIEVEYAPRPAVLDARQAMKKDAPLVHADLGSYDFMKGVFAPQPGTNIAHHQKIRAGNLEEGFRGSDLVHEASFMTAPVQHVPLETHAVIAQALPGGRTEVWTSSQSPYMVRHLLALTFGLPHQAIRVHVPYVGGGFGGKAGLHLEPLAIVLSRAAGGRPVKVVATREEEFNTLPSRQGLHSTIKIGVTQDGSIQALQATYVWDAGAYADYGVNVGRAAAYSGAGPYAIPHCAIDSYVVYTNKVFGTAYRGFGHLEVLWAVERAIDQVAHKLGMDPYEFRMKNLLKAGDRTITGETVTPGHGRPDLCLEAAAKEIGWGTQSVPSSDPRKVRGKGLACLHKAPAMPTYTSCAAIIKLDEDGGADVLVSGVDYGQGTYTTLRQIAAEELKIQIERVHVVNDCDTAFTPYDWQTVASRFSFMGGNAVIEASKDCLRQLRATAALALKVRPDEIDFQDGFALVATEPLRRIPYKDLALGYTFQNGSSVGGPVIGHGRYIATGLTHLDLETGQGRPAQFWTYGAHGVEIEVDTETGEVEVLKVATALDAGKVLNPLQCRGQVVGGVVQGLGSALWEGFLFSEDGRLQNGSFTDYKIPTSKDVPHEIVPIFIETPQPDGPYGARGVAEHPMVSIPSAVGNALYNALKIDFDSIPLTAERIQQGIAARSRA